MSKSVIVIDDDEDTVRLFSEFLEENGIHVIGNGFDVCYCCEIIQRHQTRCCFN